MFGFGNRPLPQRVFEQTRAGNFQALQQSTASLPDIPPSLAPRVTDLEYTDREGRTALCLAAARGNVPIASLLIRKGANLNACSNRPLGGTPLHEATYAASSPDMVNLLLSSGASPFIANHRGSTCYDIAIERKIPSLVRRFEAAAKLGAFVSIKVPGLLGFGSEFKEFWAVLFQRVPNPSVPPHRRVSHSQLYLFTSYSDAVPVAKVWTDGAQVATLNNAPNSSSASAILMLHHQHQKPSHVYVDFDSARRPCIFLRPSAKPSHSSSLATLATCINDTTAAAAAAHGAAAGAAAPGGAAGGAQPLPLYTPAAGSSSGATATETAAGSAWALAAAAASSAAALAGSVMTSNTSTTAGGPAGTPTPTPNYEQAPGRPQPPPSPYAPSAPPAPVNYGAPNVPVNYHTSQSSVPQQPAQYLPVPLSRPPAAVPAQAPAATNGAAPPASPQLPDTADETAKEGEESCIICFENKKTIGFLHQGTMHLCACRSCALKWFEEHKTCPMCNVTSETLVPVFT